MLAINWEKFGVNILSLVYHKIFLSFMLNCNYLFSSTWDRAARVSFYFQTSFDQL